MEETKYDYEIVSKMDITDGAWKALNENDSLTNEGFTQDQFKELQVQTEQGLLQIIFHVSLLEDEQTVETIIRNQIDAEIQKNGVQ